MSGDLPPSKLLAQHKPHMCNRKRTTYNRRSSADPCLLEISFNHVTAEEPRKSRHSMPAPSSNSPASKFSSSVNSWEHSAQELPRLPATSETHSSDFSSASLDPPITRKVLSELDIPRLKNDLNFRHDLNFDPESELRINAQGPQAEKRRERQGEYWDALAAEVAILLAHHQESGDSYANGALYSLSHRAGIQNFPQNEPRRLPRLFEAIRDILKHLLPPEEWPMIEAALDVRLLMQQLEHGVCNLIALSDWLSDYLRRFCAPTRDCMLDTMTSAIQLGVEDAKTDSVLHGLMTAFEFLQGMNLDATNHSLRKLRLAWVESTIAYEQSVFLRHMAYGWDVMGARIWFHDLQKPDGEPCPGLWTLAKALTDAIVFFHWRFPPTLTLDLNRLRKLQFDFQFLVYQAACRRTLTQTLRTLLGWRGKIAKASFADLFYKVAVLISDQELQYDCWQTRESVALEIVRAAYTVCSNREPPHSKDLDFAKDYLRSCCDPGGPIFKVLRGSLATQLEDKVDEEMCAIEQLTPGQLMRHLVPRRRIVSVQSEVDGLVNIAKRVVHIAELHWRVWGPILYERPMHVMGRLTGDGSFLDEDSDAEGSSLSRSTNELGESLRNTGLG